MAACLGFEPGTAGWSLPILSEKPRDSFSLFVRLVSMGDGGFHFCLLDTVIHHLEGHFLAEMAGQQIGLNDRETKLA